MEEEPMLFETICGHYTPSKVYVHHSTGRNINAGFFSCCSIRLHYINLYITEMQKLPPIVDTSSMFRFYKEENVPGDITYEYFEPYDNIDIELKLPIDYQENYQYRDYNTLDFEHIIPLITKYFSPSQTIKNIIDTMTSKYNLDFENICVLFYRGNDKNKETRICQYSDYVSYADKVLEHNKNIRFMLQSDETGFLDFFSERYPENSFYMKDEIRHIPRHRKNTVDKVFRESNHIYSKYYLAITIIMSKCKYIICGTGNCSIWIAFYRGHAKNMIQNNRGRWADFSEKT
jgi:hypothetical protein